MLKGIPKNKVIHMEIHKLGARYRRYIFTRNDKFLIDTDFYSVSLSIKRAFEKLGYKIELKGNEE